MNIFEIKRNNETPQEKANRMGVPTFPYHPNVLPKQSKKETQPRNPLGPRAICGKCGVELHDVMGYVCPHSDCPCGLGSNIVFNA